MVGPELYRFQNSESLNSLRHQSIEIMAVKCDAIRDKINKSHFVILVTDKCNERDNCSKLEVFKFLVGNNIFVRNHSRNFHFLFL